MESFMATFTLPPVVIETIRSLVAASIGGLIVACTTHYFTNERARGELKATKFRLAHAFYAELTAMFAIYEQIKLQPWANVNEPIDLNLVSIHYDYLAIFNSNADKIGLFPPEDAAELMKFYIFAKSYIDTLRELARRWNNHFERKENHFLHPQDVNIREIYHKSASDLFGIYQFAYKQQNELYQHFDDVQKTFKKYL